MIGEFYLILSIVRILMVAGSILSLTPIPNNKDVTGNDSDTFILIRFCAHILGQIGVHLYIMVIMVIATKINNDDEWHKCDCRYYDGGMYGYVNYASFVVILILQHY